MLFYMFAKAQSTELVGGIMSNQILFYCPYILILYTRLHPKPDSQYLGPYRTTGLNDTKPTAVQHRVPVGTAPGLQSLG